MKTTTTRIILRVMELEYDNLTKDFFKPKSPAPPWPVCSAAVPPADVRGGPRAAAVAAAAEGPGQPKPDPNQPAAKKRLRGADVAANTGSVLLTDGKCQFGKKRKPGFWCCYVSKLTVQISFSSLTLLVLRPRPECFNPTYTCTRACGYTHTAQGSRMTCLIRATTTSRG